MSQNISVSPNGDTDMPLPLTEGRGSSPLETSFVVQHLVHAQRTKSQTEQELETAVRVRSTTPKMSPLEVSEKDREIMELRRRLHDLDEQINRAQSTIRRQQATILTQSKQIERPSHNQPMSEPRMTQHGHDSTSASALGPPPPFNPSAPYGHGRQELYGGSSWDTPVSRSRQYTPQSQRVAILSDVARNANPISPLTVTALRVNCDGSPQMHHQSDPSTPNHQPRSFNHGQAPSYHHVQGSRMDPFMSPITQALTNLNDFGIRDRPSDLRHGVPNHNEIDSSRPSPDQYLQLSGPVHPASILEPEFDMDATISDGISRVFDMVIEYAYAHANFANTAGDNALPDDLKQRILKAATQQTAFPLMKTSETRFWLVSKIMIQWLIKHIFRNTTFSGLDKDVDQLIEGTKASIYQSTPPQLRFLMLNNISNHVRTITSHPKFMDYMQHLTQHRAETLYWLVRPMAHQPTMGEMQSLIEIIQEAHQVAQMMFTGPDEYKFQFSEFGERFDRYTMMNVDPKYVSCSDDEMRNRFATVRLGATPQVVVRKGNADGVVKEVGMQRGRVLLRIRNGD